MGTFGTYETVRELHRSGLTSMWSARPAGSNGEPAFAVKLCEPDPDIAGPEAAAQAIQAFLNQAKVQQEAAAGARWARVHASGVHESGAYLVTDLFPRTAERLVLGRVRPDAAALRAITTGVVDGLRELEKQAQRQHGNLKPSNVLLGGGDLANVRVVLCDPLPSRAARGLKPGADGRAVADLVHQLVAHQPVRGAFPIAPAPEWNALGRTRDAWLKLCNRLLDPHPEGGPATLQEIADTLSGSAFTPATRRKPLPLVLAGAALVLVAGGSVFFFTRGGDKSVLQEVGFEWEPQGRENWEELCQAYVDNFLSFAQALEEPPAAGAGTAGTRRELYLQSDPRLAEPLGQWAAARKDDMYTPGRVIGRPRAATDSLKNSEKAREPLAMAHTLRLLGVVRGLDQSIAGGWPPAHRLAEAAAAFNERGWVNAGKHAGEAADLAAEPSWEDRAARMDSVLAADAIVAGIQKRLGSLTSRAQTLQGEGDRVLGRFGEIVSEADRADGQGSPVQALSGLDESLAQIDAIGARLGEAVAREWAAVDREFFISQSPAYSPDLASRPAREVLETWLVEVKRPKYAQLDPAADPVRTWGLDQKRSDIDARLSSLRDEQRENPDEQLAQAVAAFEERATRLGADANAVTATVWNRANEAAKRSGSERASADAGVLLGELDGFISVISRNKVASADDARQKLAADNGPAPDSPALSAVWVAWRDELVRGLDQSNYRQRAKHAGETRDLLARANAAVPPAPAPLSAEREWNRALAAVGAREREARVAGVLRAFPSAPQPGGGSEVESAAARAGEDFARWVADLNELGARLNAIEDLLDRAYGLDEAPADGGPTVRQRYQEVAGSAVMAQQDVAEACRHVTGRVEVLRTIADARDAPVLGGFLTAGGTAEPEAVLAAWRSLDSVPNWPGTAEDLRREASFRDRVRVEIGRLTDAPRQGLLRDELALAGRTRWERALASAAGPAEIEGVIGQMSAFGVDAGSIQNPRLRYNAFVHDFKRAVAPGGGGARAGPSDDEVRTAARAFLTRLGGSAQGPLTAVQSDAKVAGLLSVARPIGDGTEPAEQQVDPTKLGPGSAGWSGVAAGVTNEQLRFTHPGGAALEFVLVGGDGAPEGDIEPTYLSTIEIPVGMVIDAFGPTLVRPEPHHLLAEGDPLGPSVWVNAGTSMSIPATWLNNTVLVNVRRFDQPPNPRGYGQKLAGMLGLQPAREHPIQQISPAAALFIARQWGCRLPTAAEWKRAWDRYGDGASLKPDTWNLRDSAWEAQRATVAEVEADLQQKGDRAMGWLPWPDQGAFVPPEKFGPPPPTGARATALGSNDGAFWIRPVTSDSGHSLHHLVGNVAEYVFEAAQQAETLEDTSATSIRNLVIGNAAKVAVIGGSAFSAPQLPLTEPLPMDTLELEILTGYADVGFRLAFSAKGVSRRKSFAVRLTEALTDNPYLTASP